jgi:hypothetical protein
LASGGWQIGRRVTVELSALTRRGVMVAAASALVAIDIFWPAGGSAQNALSPSGDLQFEAAFARPAELDTSLRYAVGSKQAGDLEAAIGTLERLLFYNPNLIRVRFELGVLYFRLGSYEMARGYFQTVLASADAADIKQRAQEFVDAIDRALQVDRWSGFFQTGIGYQTNASAGPGQQALLASNLTVDNRLLRRPDWNWFGAVGVTYVHDFGNQRGDVVEASVLGYDTQQFTQHEFDFGWLEVRAGPRFGIFQDVLNGASIKPYVLATGATLANAPYLGAAGGGLTTHFNVADVVLDPYFEFERGDYRSSALFPSAAGFDGTLSTFALQAAGPLLPDVRWLGRVAFNHSDDAFPWFSFDRYALDVCLYWTVPMPWGGRSWIVSPGLSLAQWAYRAPDPTVNAFTAERAFEWQAGVALDIPIGKQTGFGVQVRYRAINSNIPIYTINDLAITMGPTVRF